MIYFRRLLHSLVLSMIACCGTSEAALIVEHVGSSDPTTEGWTALPGGGGGVSVGPINDGGTPAWFVDDNSTAINTIFLYEHTIPPADIAVGNSLGWTLSATLRVASDEALSVDGSPVVTYRDGVNGWQMSFGLNASGDTVVRLYTGSTTGPVHTIAGNSTYNTLSLIYDPVAANADLFVNGFEVISDYAGFSDSQTAVLWGAGRSPDQGQGNFSGVSFTTFPEPSAIPAVSESAMVLMVLLMLTTCAIAFRFGRNRDRVQEDRR